MHPLRVDLFEQILQAAAKSLPPDGRVLSDLIVVAGRGGDRRAHFGLDGAGGVNGGDPATGSSQVDAEIEPVFSAGRFRFRWLLTGFRDFFHRLWLRHFHTAGASQHAEAVADRRP